MIDVSNEIFNAVATAVRAKHSPIAVIPENTSVPASFPTVAMDETYNVPSHQDSSQTEKYASVTYRVQVFCAGDGKRAKAREIFATVADAMHGLNLMRKTYTTTPDIYNSSVYQISATFEADVRHDGFVFRR